MRHARPADLDPLGDLLEGLRSVPGLRERTPGNFARGSEAFLHFHVDPSGLFADLKVDGAFERFRVTTRREQERFLARTRRAAGAPPRVSRPRTS